MIDAIITALTDALKKLPGATIPSSHIGTEAPVNNSGLPSIAVGLAESRLKVSGIGGIVTENKLDPVQWEQRYANRLEGVLRMDVYAGGDGEAFSLSGVALQQLEADRTELRGAGFLRMGTVTWDRMETITMGQGNNGPTAKRQTLSMEFTYEHVQQDLPGPGGIIQQIDVEIQPPVEEDFTIN